MFTQKFNLVLFLAFSSLAVPVVANSQGWLEDRKVKEGPGFKIGESLVLHVGVLTEIGYDSNAKYEHDPVRAGRFRIAPYVDISTRSQRRMDNSVESVQHAAPRLIFRAGLAAFYDRYFSNEKSEVEKFNQGYNPFGFDFHSNFTVYPERKVSLLGGLTYLKTLDPYDSNSDAQGKHNLTPNIGLQITPGGGTLTIEPKYRLNLKIFDDPGIAKNYNRVSNEIAVSTRWKIFPKTALISNVLYAPTVYFGNYAENVDSHPIKSWVGAQGLIFEKIGFRALIGYGVGFYEFYDDFEGVIGDIALMFYPSELSRLTLGGKRDFIDSTYANYYEMNGGYLKLERFFAGRFLLRFDGTLYKRSYAYYGGEKRIEHGNGNYSVTIPNTPARDEVWITANTLAELRATEWLSFRLSMRFWRNITDFESDISTYVDNDLISVTTEIHDFAKVEVFFGVDGHF